MNITKDVMGSTFTYDTETGIFTNRLGKKLGWINHSGYVLLGTKKHDLRAHRVAWYLVHDVWPSHDIDHINGIRETIDW